MSTLTATETSIIKNFPKCPKCGAQSNVGCQAGTQRVWLCKPCGKMFRAKKVRVHDEDSK